MKDGSESSSNLPSGSGICAFSPEHGVPCHCSHPLLIGIVGTQAYQFVNAHQNAYLQLLDINYYIQKINEVNFCKLQKFPNGLCVSSDMESSKWLSWRPSSISLIQRLCGLHNFEKDLARSSVITEPASQVTLVRKWEERATDDSLPGPDSKGPRPCGPHPLVGCAGRHRCAEQEERKRSSS